MGKTKSKKESKGKKAKPKKKDSKNKAVVKKPKTLGLTARREKAFSLFGQGYNNSEVARELGVSRTTAIGYKNLYEQKIAQEVSDNPGLLRDAVANTVRSLEEINQVRRELWERLKWKGHIVNVKCDHCGEYTEHEVMAPPSDATVVQCSNALLKAGEQRAKLLGLLGVRQEVLVEVQSVNIVQNRIMGWLTDNLEGPQREALASFVEIELAEYVRKDDGPVPVIEATVIHELAGAAQETELLPQD